MPIVLVFVVVCTWFVVLRRYGPFSFVSAGVFCLTVYSIPAVLGLVFPFHDAGYLGLTSSSVQAVLVTVLAWIALLLALIVRAPNRHGGNSAFEPDLRLEPFVVVALIYCVAGYLLIAAMDGPLFFLAPREEQAQSTVRLLWRWVNAVGLVSAVLANNRRAAIVFAAALAVYFLAGDRTVLVITAFCLIVLYAQGRSLRDFFRWRIAVTAGAGTLLGLFGKPIYLAIKAGSLDQLMLVGDSGWFELALTTFEPFVTFNILDLVLIHRFTMSVWDVVAGCLGQLLLVPSAFGLDSNSFNAEFTAEFVPDLSYGVAGNYWAQGWAIGGVVGVILYGWILALSLRVLDGWSRKYSGTTRVLCGLIGALVAVYVHRNSLDNLLSFVRQIVLVIVAIAAPATVLARFASRPSAWDVPKSQTTAGLE